MGGDSLLHLLSMVFNFFLVFKGTAEEKELVDVVSDNRLSVEMKRPYR
jgi:thioredoxin-related protein